VQSPQVAAKRKVLVDALTMCLDRSKVKELVSVDTIRSILQSASRELWREGEFRLELVWKILCQQPGLSAQEVAPPLLAFKALEAELGVDVRVPQAISSLPVAEQNRLRDELPLRDFAKAIAEMKAIAEEEAKRGAAPTIADAAREASQQDAPVKPRPKRTGLAIALGVFTALALSSSFYIALRDAAKDVDVSGLAPILRLADARRAEGSLVARIADPRWETMSKEEQRRLAVQLFDRVEVNGVRALTLTDANGRVRVNATNITGSALINVN
jgi:hypothetical protein